MPERKKVESKDITPKDVTGLSFFASAELINEITALAEKNKGELTDDQLAVLVEAQTLAPAKLGKLCNFMKLLDAEATICADRIKEIQATQKRKKELHERLKKHLAKFVDGQGKSYHVGEYELKTRKTKSVKLIDEFDNPLFCKTETEIVVTPDKAAIKEALIAGEKVPGAELVEKLNLSIK